MVKQFRNIFDHTSNYDNETFNCARQVIRFPHGWCFSNNLQDYVELMTNHPIPSWSMGKSCFEQSKIPNTQVHDKTPAVQEAMYSLLSSLPVRTNVLSSNFRCAEWIKEFEILNFVFMWNVKSSFESKIEYFSIRNANYRYLMISKRNSQQALVAVGRI